MAEVIAGTAIIGGAKAGVETAAAVQEHGLAVQARQTKTYDFEKVFFNSMYGVGLFGLSWVALKTGQFMIWAINVLNSIPGIGLAIPDEPLERMNRVGEILSTIDGQFFIPIGPVVPLGIVAGCSAIEYLRVRKFLDKNMKLFGDVTCAAGGGAAAYLGLKAWQSSMYYDLWGIPEGKRHKPRSVTGGKKYTGRIVDTATGKYGSYTLQYDESRVFQGKNYLMVDEDGEVIEAFSHTNDADAIKGFRVWVSMFG